VFSEILLASVFHQFDKIMISLYHKPQSSDLHSSTYYHFFSQLNNYKNTYFYVRDTSGILEKKQFGVDLLQRETALA
jgi:hypothetical protein